MGKRSYLFRMIWWAARILTQWDLPCLIGFNCSVYSLCLLLSSAVYWNYAWCSERMVEVSFTIRKKQTKKCVNVFLSILPVAWGGLGSWAWLICDFGTIMAGASTMEICLHCKNIDDLLFKDTLKIYCKNKVFVATNNI